MKGHTFGKPLLFVSLIGALIIVPLVFYGNTIRTSDQNTSHATSVISTTTYTYSPSFHTAIPVMCNNADCFRAQFASCEPGVFVSYIQGGMVRYRVIEGIRGRCTIGIDFIESEIPDLRGKEMVCIISNVEGIDHVLQDVIQGLGVSSGNCEGSLIAHLRELSKRKEE